MPRRPKEKVDIDVVPYLSIMVIVLKLICLILIVTVMRIALNPYGLKVVSFAQLYQVAEQKMGSGSAMKIPTYVECSFDGLSIFPGHHKVPLSEIGSTGGTFDQILAAISGKANKEYVILIVRPNSVRTFREVRKMLAHRKIDIGYDVLDEDTQIDWEKEMRNAGIEEKG